MNETTKNGFTSGTSAVVGMFCGNLFLENVKMEKQRTNLSYYDIVKQFKSRGLKGFYSGLYPWGIMTGYVKGFGVGASSYFFDKMYSETKYKKPLVGVSVGVAEAVMVSPLLLLRNHTNKNIVNNVKQTNWLLISNYVKTNGIASLWKGTSVFAVRRGLDWGSRFLLIQQLKNTKFYKKHNSMKLNIATTFVASSATVLITTPLDRLLPKIYTEKQSIIQVINEIKVQGIRSIYSGTTVRALNTGFVTCWILLFPQIIEKLF